MIVAGVGCRRGASASDVEAAVRAALARADIAANRLDAIATVEGKHDEAGIYAAAATLGVTFVVVSATDLQAAAARAVTHSERVLQLMGVPSVAETAALAAAGPSARLLGARLAVGGTTCALAASEAAP